MSMYEYQGTANLSRSDVFQQQQICQSGSRAIQKSSANILDSYIEPGIIELEYVKRTTHPEWTFFSTYWQEITQS